MRLCGPGGGSSRFTTVDEVRVYFQHDALVGMFGADANVPDQDDLDYLAELVIDADPGSYTTWGDIEADTTDSRIAQLAEEAGIDDDQPLCDRRDALAEASDERDIEASDGNADVTLTVSRSPGQSWDDAAEEAVRDDWADGDWGEGKNYVQVTWHWAVENCDWRELHHLSVEVGSDPEEPECAEDHEHDWGSPPWLGGCRENPGVWSIGGTQVATIDVCRHCGAYRHYTSESTPGQCPRVPARTEYEEPDEQSLAWVAENREE
jgi:hypothetical protein